MEYDTSADVGDGSFILVKENINISQNSKPVQFGIYWGTKAQDKFDRQCCHVYTNETITLLNNEYITLSRERVEEYRDNGWMLVEINAPTIKEQNIELIEKCRTLAIDEKECIWALQIDGLSESRACEEYFLSRHGEYNNNQICYLPNKNVIKELKAYGFY